ncbi:MAG: RdgB/HAM1 family non-canonical purine NTP pyrophosphatase [Gammaproteobacteria bacterium]|nr:RdgB/HAM1 family non-canonical purine NTP pyrophosphatase [Gammaproteobacteria bacterium]
MSQVVLASNNPGKLAEITRILADMDMTLVTQSDLNVPEVEETGKSFVENALLKARNASAISGFPAIADDSGIEVDILNGEPGIYSARYAGIGATDEANLKLLVDNITKAGGDRPVARYQCVIVYMRHASDPMPLIAEGTWEGYLVTDPLGDNGFGYDPIFYVPEYQCTSAQLEPEIKNMISHRGMALKKLAEKLHAN